MAFIGTPHLNARLWKLVLFSHQLFIQSTLACLSSRSSRPLTSTGRLFISRMAGGNFPTCNKSAHFSCSGGFNYPWSNSHARWGSSLIGAQLNQRKNCPHSVLNYQRHIFVAGAKRLAHTRSLLVDIYQKPTTSKNMNHHGNDSVGGGSFSDQDDKSIITSNVDENGNEITDGDSYITKESPKDFTSFNTHPSHILAFLNSLSKTNYPRRSLND